MAIAFDAVSAIASGASVLSYSHTCTGDNRILFVGFAVNTGGDTSTGITYNGVAMTKINGLTVSGQGDALWVLMNPASGENTVAVTASSGTITSMAISYTGANQADQPDAANTNTSTAAGTYQAAAVSVTTLADNCWNMAWLAKQFNTAEVFSAGAGTTIRAQAVGDIFRCAMMDSNAAKTPAGAVSLGVTWSPTNRDWGMHGASFDPSVAVAVSKNWFGRRGATNRPTSRSGWRRSGALWTPV